MTMYSKPQRPRCAVRVMAASVLAALPLLFFTSSAAAKTTPTSDDAVSRVVIIGARPSSLPTEIPTTIESITAKQLERDINATDAEDALKYFPSLLVRKRYIGDYNHAVLASRASGTGNSARSLVYADGILLSNLLGNGAGFTPRWGNVTPEEIERVDVLYGPFSAAYSGNSVGAIVDYITKMPSKFEAHDKIQGFTECFHLYSTDKSYSGKQLSLTLGNKNGDLAWWFDLNHGNSAGQPLVFANKLVTGPLSSAGTAVSGAILDKNPSNKDWWLIGSNTQYNTIQDHAKIKLAYAITPDITAAYTVGYWHNNTDGNAESYLKDAAGNVVYSGDINLAGRKYTLAAADFSPTKNALEHINQGLDIKTNGKGVFDWELAGSTYDYRKDTLRTPTVFAPAALTGGAGRITDQHGTGWNTFALKGIWRPDTAGKQHTVEFGYQREAYRLRTEVSTTPDWISGTASTRFSAFNGDTRLQSLYLQDAWRIDPQWKAIIGGRDEQWNAQNGSVSNANTTQQFGARSEHYFSPKAALSYRASDDWTYKASIGRAVRMPTVSELYQGSIAANPDYPATVGAPPSIIINTDPHLKPEQSITTEWTAERDLSNGVFRSTFFYENTQDALFSQALSGSVPLVNTVQNVDQMRTMGLEFAYQQDDVWASGLDLSSSLTFADSRIVKNDNLPASVGKYQARVPKWRANFVASYRASTQLNYTFGIRYSSAQYGQLDNSDTNGFAYTGFSKFLVADVRIRYKFNQQLSGAIGIDNLNNDKYWAFHPYTQRTLLAELKFDY